MDELILVRHGETTGNSAVRLYGRTDIALSDLGRRQMSRVREALDSEAFDTVITSPLSRARESAAIILNASGPEPLIFEELSEIDFGRWEGWTFAEAAERDPDHHAAWARGEPEFRFPGGESRIGFQSRVAEACDAHVATRPGKTLAVLHKGVIKIIYATLLGLTFDEYKQLPVELGSIHRFENEADRWRLEAANQASHLGPERVVESS